MVTQHGIKGALQAPNHTSSSHMGWFTCVVWAVVVQKHSINVSFEAAKRKRVNKSTCIRKSGPDIPRSEIKSASLNIEQLDCWLCDWQHVHTHSPPERELEVLEEVSKHIDEFQLKSLHLPQNKQNTKSRNLRFSSKCIKHWRKNTQRSCFSVI